MGIEKQEYREFRKEVEQKNKKIVEVLMIIMKMKIFC